MFLLPFFHNNIRDFSVTFNTNSSFPEKTSNMTTERKSDEAQMAQGEISQENLPSDELKDKNVVTTVDNKVGKEDGEFNKDGEHKVDNLVEGQNVEAEKGEASSSNANEKTDSFKGGASSSNANEKTDSLKGDTSSSNANDKPYSLKVEGDSPFDLKEYEKKALLELRSKLEEAILTNLLFKQQKDKFDNTKPNHKEQLEKTGENKESHIAQEGKEKGEGGKFEKKGENEEKQELEEEKDEKLDPGESKLKTHKSVEEKPVEITKDIRLWGVPLLPSKGHEGTDVILLKFLRAREFKANEAFEMLRDTLQWRKENSIDLITNEDFGSDYDSAVYLCGVDREGHPVCYNVYGVFGDEELYNRTFGTEESREKFLRWRLQLMETEIQKLDFTPGGVSSILQINDLKNTPGPSRKDLRLATKQAVALLQDNYPEFVARNIFVNVPFWYYAFNALLSPFLTQRTKSKFVFSRSSRVTETLLKYIAMEEIPVQYGGLKRNRDSEFSIKDVVSEITVKAGSTETIELTAPVAGRTFIWDLTVLGWEVDYKEEFVPTDEGSYTMIIQKGRKKGWQEGPVRNSFRNNEPGKVVLTIGNGSFKKKRVLFRSKTKNSSPSSSQD